MSEKKVSVLINAGDVLGHINPEIYGHFSEHLGRCIYEGIYVGEDSEIPNEYGIRKDVIDAFRQIKMPALRWPGGCFADEYHWKDGVGPKKDRKEIINTNWGGVTEDNSFGTHEFLKLCELVGCEPYITGNVGSGTVQEMSEWVEYMTSDAESPMTKWRKENGREKPWKLKYLGVGNENWGCGGNMRPERYADEYRRYQTYCKNHSDNQLYKIACGPNASDFEWMEVLMKNLRPDQVNGIDLHYYTIYDWNRRGHATEFDAEAYYKTLGSANYLDTLLTRHTEIMNRYDPDNKIGLVVGEWGTWYEVEKGTNPGFLYQQNTMRDAIVAAMELNIFNRHSRRVVMANLAQTVNVLQAILLTEGSKVVKTPTFHVFDMYREHQGADAVYCFAGTDKSDEAEGVPALSSSASVKNGKMTVTFANTSLTDSISAECSICGFEFNTAKAMLLTNEVHACNDFENGDRVVPVKMEIKAEDGVIRLNIPACAVVSISLE